MTNQFFDLFQENCDRLRPLSYFGRDIILLCFDIGDESTLLLVKEKFIPDLDKHVPNIPRILVGCKSGNVYILYTHMYKP